MFLGFTLRQLGIGIVIVVAVIVILTELRRK
jgi:hypothetical protein